MKGEQKKMRLKSGQEIESIIKSRMGEPGLAIDLTTALTNLIKALTSAGYGVTVKSHLPESIREIVCEK